MGNSLIITGGTGFIGSSFVRKITKQKSNDKIILVGKENKRIGSNLEQINIDQLGYQLGKIKNNKVSVFHFATFYSKKNEDKESILDIEHKIRDINHGNVPLRFKLLNLPIDINIKARALRRLEGLNK